MPTVETFSRCLDETVAAIPSDLGFISTIAALAPDFWCARPDYDPTHPTSEGLGEWEAEVGDDLYGLDSFATPAPLTAVGGGPVFAITPITAPFGNVLYNLTAVEDCIGVGEHHLMVVATPLVTTGYGPTTQAAFNPLALGTFSGSLGLTVHLFGGTYYATFFEYDTFVAASVRYARVSLGASLPGRLVLQGKKEAGSLWIKVNGAAWVQGSLCGDTEAQFETDYGGGVACGTFRFIGLVEAVAVWKRALSVGESNALALAST